MQAGFSRAPGRMAAAAFTVVKRAARRLYGNDSLAGLEILRQAGGRL